MTTRRLPAWRARETVATIFGRLYENEFATLDDIAISCRSEDGITHVEGMVALAMWLADDGDVGSPSPADRADPADPADPVDRDDPAARRLHEALHAALPEHDTVISGSSRHLRALLLEGYPPPPSTSMLRARGVPDIGAHMVAPEALAPSALATTIEGARALARRGGMRHLLIVTTAGQVVVSGAPPFEAMAHWHNIEFAARVEVLRLEEAARPPV